MYSRGGPNPPSTCYTVSKTTSEPDCIDMGTAYWYGGSEMRKQYWPINKVNVPMKAYVSHDTIQDMFGSVVERYFLSSNGTAITMDEDQPLFASINDNKNNQICLKSQNVKPYAYPIFKKVSLTYSVCSSTDIKAIHDATRSQFKKPTGIPNPDLFRKPIWSTWAQYKADINQSIVIDFLDTIEKNNFTIGQLEIDDNWTPKYGDLTFKTSTFPNASIMIAEIHSRNLPVTLWVHPFLNNDSEGFKTAKAKGYLVMNWLGTKPALTNWWNGKDSGVVDFTNPAAANWYLDELKKLQAIGVDSFKFDAGETTYLPVTPYRLHNGAGNPDSYTEAYARTVSKIDLKNRIEIRTGVQTQDLPVMVRQIDKYSTWGYDEGFKTILTTALTFSIFGYPFVMPDYIGGNGYNGNLPSSELYIRWVQANALMPIMQFSYTPWFFKNETVSKITRDMIALHESYGDKFVALARNSTVTGDPIMRPMWWIAPNDEEALTTDSQFMLGDDVLVAPVMDQGVTSRQIYLPSGQWKDELNGQVISGPRTLDYPVKLEDLPRFTKID
ncbi:hypothetical protein LOTGIDRAFT_105457 [Lottia gigantea]|uniref:Glycoside hydrolase family 31 N-terminal domain-containing protein n=1 Tax=Lottia gigantea TaxID=225164 RepID=V4A832_LOTGI|nr:hypothetical protein LOTGIDRAFT_105457 [Lottia gigantea]ESO91210.1 hypothetical protein LOTGIDRAFT_105457 [Lottia gigantea]